jgi:transcriptional regulator with XRE-family HTH domain
MREAQGDTMETFAVRMKVAMNTVSRWENSQPPRGKTLEKLYRFAKKHGPSGVADMLLAQIETEKDQQYRRIRRAQILDAKNLMNVQAILIFWWSFERDQGMNPQRREYFLMLADRLWHGGRKEFLGEDQ